MIVAFRCLCGKLHTLLRKEVLEGLGLSHWKLLLQSVFQQDTGSPIALPLYPDDVDGKPIGT